MTPELWRQGEVAVLGLGRSGEGAGRLLRAHHARVYASDVASTPATAAVAEALRGLGANVEEGGHDLARIARASLVVVSPGIPADAAPVRAAREALVPVVSEVEIALAAMPTVKTVVVTGTNGKSTVTAMVGHLLAALGHDVEVAGNIGRPLSDVALRGTLPEWVALEISSYQLHDTPSLSPTVGVMTNLSPDHLDRYPTIEAYYADKRLLFRNAGKDSRWVVNLDDPVAMEFTRGLAGYVLRFSADHHLADAFYDRQHETLILMDEPLMPRADLPLHGRHNAGNALAAALAVSAADPAHTSLLARGTIAAALRTVPPLPHRLETVGEVDGVLWINDSKATNVASARVGISSMTRRTVVLLGGRHKGEPYTPLIEPIREHCRVVLAYGEAAEEIERDLGGAVPVERIPGDFADVVARARALALPGESVLLSPACASFDQFANYEARGRAFARLARGEVGAA